MGKVFVFGCGKLVWAIYFVEICFPIEGRVVHNDWYVVGGSVDIGFKNNVRPKRLQIFISDQGEVWTFPLACAMGNIENVGLQE